MFGSKVLSARMSFAVNLPMSGIGALVGCLFLMCMQEMSEFTHTPAFGHLVASVPVTQLPVGLIFYYDKFGLLRLQKNAGTGLSSCVHFYVNPYSVFRRFVLHVSKFSKGRSRLCCELVLAFARSQ
jgi:hypothetical protein